MNKTFFLFLIVYYYSLSLRKGAIYYLLILKFSNPFIKEKSNLRRCFTAYAPRCDVVSEIVAQHGNFKFNKKQTGKSVVYRRLLSSEARGGL